MSSATGGYLRPTATTQLPGGLTLTQFIQSILVGISGLSGELVRPKWQRNPPKQPEIDVNWIAFAVVLQKPDTYAYIGLDTDGNAVYEINGDVNIQCGFYGPLGMDYAQIVRDGLQLSQNSEVMRAANIGFKNTGPILFIPDLVNERFVERWEMEVILRRELNRTYAILPLVSAEGTIYSDTDPEYSQNWQTPPEETS